MGLTTRTKTKTQMRKRNGEVWSEFFPSRKKDLWILRNMSTFPCIFSAILYRGTTFETSCVLPWRTKSPRQPPLPCELITAWFCYQYIIQIHKGGLLTGSKFFPVRVDPHWKVKQKRKCKSYTPFCVPIRLKVNPHPLRSDAKSYLKLRFSRMLKLFFFRGIAQMFLVCWS